MADREEIELTASDGHRLSAFEVDPGGARAGIVVVQEIFGVNAHMRAVADGYGALGYRVVAPALFDRVERGVELDYDQEGMERGRATRAGVDWDWTVLDVGAAVAHLAPLPVAVIGFCYGGGVAWRAAAALPVAAAVGYYGGQIIQFVDEMPRCPVLLHFGADDAMITPADIEAISTAHPDVTVHVYGDAGHGFNRSIDGPGKVAADLALDRTTSFLAQHLS